MRKWRWSAASVFLLAACSNDGESQGEKDLKAAQARWDAQELYDYTFTLKVNCYCTPTTPRNLAVQVHGGSVTAATDTETGMPVPAEDLPEVPSIDGLFETLDAAYDDDADDVQVDYDDTLGYPVTISIDFSSGISDDEIGYIVEDLSGLAEHQ